MRVSVIVCTRNRAHQIIPCLDSIAASLAHAAPVDAEIVVVDNGSTDNTSALVKEWAASSAFPMQLMLEPKAGVSRARNCGLHTAQGDLIVFTDDDCRLDINHIKDALRHDDAERDPILRGGRIELGDPTDLPLTIKPDPVGSRWTRRPDSPRNANLFHIKLGFNMIIGCNIVMRREIIERVGFFDEELGPGTNIPGVEDSDYTLRAWLAGITVEYVPDMIVYHCHGRKEISDGKKLMQNYMIATGGLYAKYLFKHPDLCRQFYWDIKNMINETIAGKNAFMPEIHMSHKDKVACNIIGVARYYTAKIKRLGGAH